MANKVPLDRRHPDDNAKMQGNPFGLFFMLIKWIVGGVFGFMSAYGIWTLIMMLF